jgi:hypothetical protein
MTPQFTTWQRWTLREELSGLEYPGVYAIAKSRPNLTGKRFSLREEIINIGETGGRLRKRLMDFDKSMLGKGGHGPAMKLAHKYREYAKIGPLLFVAISPFTSIPPSTEGNRLRIKGEVYRIEHYLLAEFIDKFADLPWLNKKGTKYKAGLEDSD